MTEVWYKIGDLFEWTFGILELMGNLPNYLFTVIGLVGIVAWLIRQKRYIKEDTEAGRLI